jgi:hypothetical protein
MSKTITMVVSDTTYEELCLMAGGADDAPEYAATQLYFHLGLPAIRDRIEELKALTTLPIAAQSDLPRGKARSGATLHEPIQLN